MTLQLAEVRCVGAQRHYTIITVTPKCGETERYLLSVDGAEMLISELAGAIDQRPLRERIDELEALPAKISGEPYASQAEAWNDALEKAAQIVERYNASFPDPECGGAPADIRALKRDAPQAG